MKQPSEEFFLVREQILPEAVRKTIRVKALLKQDASLTINEAVKRMNLSRSAYYKYKDHVAPFYVASREKTLTFAFLLENRKGVLSSLLAAIAKAGGNVLTIHQGIPSHALANVTLSVETKNLSMELEAFLEKLRRIAGVQQMELLGQS